jgi:hypothetical protein
MIPSVPLPRLTPALAACAILACTALACGNLSGRPADTTTAQPRASTSDQPDTSGVVVLELFTSEGCSSCPAAERVLAALARSSDNRHLFALEFHVDYWNHLGWRDRFSDAAYSARQRSYAAAIGSDVYTPQLVVNGGRDVVGSDASGVAGAIAEARAGNAHTIGLRAELIPGTRTVRVWYTNNDAADANLRLNVAVVESSAQTDVTAGENSGRKLAHTNVVRAFTTVAAAPGNGSDAIELALPNDVSPATARVIAFTQEPDSYRVRGAGACLIAH